MTSTSKGMGRVARSEYERPSRTARRSLRSTGRQAVHRAAPTASHHIADSFGTTFSLQESALVLPLIGVSAASPNGTNEPPRPLGIAKAS